MSSSKRHADPLTALSSCLLALGDVTFGSSVDRVLDDAMRTLQPLVRFERAWWGQVSAGRDEARNWLQGDIGLSATFGAEWNRFGTRDLFGQASMQQLGRVVRSRDGDRPPPDDILAFCMRYDLRHAMSITIELPGSGQLFFMALYRGLGRAAFDDEDAALFAEFAAHLLQGWRRRLAAVQTRLGATCWEAFGLADAQGRLLYLGRRMAAELERAFPGWSGWRLPAALIDAHAGPRVPTSMRLQRIGASLVVACTRGGQRRPGLSPALWNVALLYAQGQPYMAIAKRLGLAPTTVRTYLREVYAQLGVRSKIELRSALHETDR